MLFTSYSFIGFVAAVLLLYYLIPKKFQWPLLLAASYIFYFFSGPENLVFILITTAATYFIAIQIEKNILRQKAYIKEHKAEITREEKKAYKEGQKKIRVRWVLLSLAVDLGILAVCKYTNFFISNINGVISAVGHGHQLSFVDLVLPMGISFYTFQSVGYLIDVYRETVPAEKNFFRFALFVSFFPQLVQGPISRYSDLSESLYAEHEYNSKTVSYGLERVLWGFFKKLVIADRLLPAVKLLINDLGTYNGVYVLFAIALYAVQLYADFTGGIDITIGIAESLGITVKENFDRPYFSKSLKEYWRRWHITMGTWFRDYIFYPLSICQWMQKFSRFSRSHFGNAIGKRLPVYLSSFMVWFATGFWHGASWNFILWGLFNWAVLMVSEEFEPLYDKFHKRFPCYKGNLVKAFQSFRTVFIVGLLHLFDLYTVQEAFKAFGSLFTAGNFHILWDGSLMNLGLTGLDYGIVILGVVLMFTVSFLQRKEKVRDRISKLSYPKRFIIWYGLFLIVLLMGAYGVGYDSSQFIYNRF